MGGQGGDGGNANDGGGGGGGAGGYGLIVQGDYVVSSGSQIAGGNGGKGGAAAGHGGHGGDGGVAILFQTSGATLVNNGLIGTSISGASGSGGLGGGELGGLHLVGGGGNGGQGVYFLGSGTVNNLGLIGGGGGAGAVYDGTSPAYFGNGGMGGAGIIINGGGNVSNGIGAVIAGGNGASGLSGTHAYTSSGGDGGDGVDLLGGGILINLATILGGSGGRGSSIPGQPFYDGTNGNGGRGIYGTGITIINSGTIIGGMGGDGTTRAAAIAFYRGTNVLELRAGSTITGNVLAFSSADTLRLGGSANSSFDASTIGSVAQYRSFGQFEKTGTSTWTLTGATSALTPWTISAGTLAVSDDNSLGNVAASLAFKGGVLQTSAAGPTLVIARNIDLQADGGTIDTLADTNLNGNVGGVGGLTKIGASILGLRGTSSYAGSTNVNGGRLQALGADTFSSASAFTVASGAVLDLNGFNQTIGSLAGAGRVEIGGATLTVGGDGTESIFSGDMSGAGRLSKVGTGRMLMSGISTYTGSTRVDGGVLEVSGSIASSVLTMVNSGAALTGVGAVGAVQVKDDAVLAPGNGVPGTSMTLTSLAMQSGAFYLVSVNPTTASFAEVTGNATLGGAHVTVNFAAGSYVQKRYTILRAGSIGGTFDPTIASDNLPSAFKTALAYDATHAYLDLSLGYAPIGAQLSVNQQNIASILVKFFNSNGGIPIAFGALTPIGLTQVSGETATGTQQTTFQAMNQFMGVMSDLSIAGRGDGSEVGDPNAYAPTDSFSYAAPGKSRSAAERDAYAAIRNWATPMAPSFEPRWRVWAAGFGGSQSTDGDAALGVNNTRSSLAGSAVGADYRLSADTLAGFALAGGGSSFSVVNGGSGRSDLFQAGAFIRHDVRAAYLRGALAYGWQDVTTERVVTVAGVDRLRAEFKASAVSGRVEGGYRLVAPWIGGIGLTPYAAGQFATFGLPAYAEQAVSGTTMFALAYGAKSVTDTTSELGLRTDKSFAITGGRLTLRGRAAWAHDFDPDRSVAATFQTLPGASFVVNGAVQAHDAALTTASAEIDWLNGWSAAATFDGAFSHVTRSYAGKGVVRYAW